MPKCEIHGAELQGSTCEIRYGLPPAPPDGYLAAERSLFPNASTWTLGGCVMDGPESSRANVEFCPACRLVQKKWEIEHRVDGFWRS